MKTEKGNITAVDIIEVVRVSLTVGDGKDESTLFRPAFQYWSTDGLLLAEVDQHKPRWEGEVDDALAMKPGGLRK